MTATPTTNLVPICFIPDGDTSKATTISVPQSELAKYLADGSTAGECPTDCKGIPFGVTVEDLCNVCGGDNSTCIQCKVDCCGVCNGDGSSCQELCNTFDLRRDKRESILNLKRLFKSVRKYSKGEMLCDAKRRGSATKRIMLATTIRERSISIIQTHIQDFAKLCDTEFCSKASVENVIEEVKINLKMLYNLSRKAQYGALAACGKPKTRGSTNHRAKKNFDDGTLSIDNIPDRHCTN